MTETRSIHKPKIVDIEPEAAKTKTVISIEGDHLGGAIKVKFTPATGSPQDVTPEVLSNELITVKVPERLPAGNTDVTVENSAGWSAPYVFAVLRS
ncbi:IPT/TIG domain-containing protein [Kitasatospora sp. NPDC091335]|uniref:IPT/TIG domain-containing protein n=1 Tax=Kitasatospora sp. NPDC091335 TaxID=3364085 RepID=UPI00380811E0